MCARATTPRSLVYECMDRQIERHRQQFLSFTFFKIALDWRRLSLTERTEHRREFIDLTRKWQTGGDMRILTYSMVGLRADCDFMLWRICHSLDCMQQMASDLHRTGIGAYLDVRHNLLGMVRRSQYALTDEPHHELRGALHAGGSKYLFLFPLVRTRPWYLLPFQERQRMVREVTAIRDEFPDMRVNIAYSLGLDEQDFIVTFEGDAPEEFVERNLRSREVDSSAYILRDTPSFLCVQTSLEDMVDQLG